MVGLKNTYELAKIRFLVLDVDGTLTDGKLYLTQSGEAFKVFDIKDGAGIKDIAIPSGIEPIIISARNSQIVDKRAVELCISYVFQGIDNKLDQLQNILDVLGGQLRECAYIGDDITDLDVMRAIREAGGIIGAPNDAINQVKSYANFVCKKSGGDGAVREFIEWIVSNL